MMRYDLDNIGLQSVLPSLLRRHAQKRRTSSLFCSGQGTGAEEQLEEKGKKESRTESEEKVAENEAQGMSVDQLLYSLSLSLYLYLLLSLSCGCVQMSDCLNVL